MGEDDEELREIRRSLSELERRVSELETTAEEPTASDRETATPDERDDAVSSGPTHAEETPPGRDAASALPDLEFALAVKVLGLAGSAALIFATVFFVQLAIERGYLGPLGRVILGMSVGLVMFGAGRHVADRRGLPGWGKLVSGTGFVIAYVAIYAMTGFTGYREAIGAPVWLSLVGIGLLVIGVVADSIRRRDVVLAGGAVVFGYVGIVLTAGEVTAVVSAGYIVGLTAVLVGSAVIRPWTTVLLAGVSAGYLSLFAWVLAREIDPGWLDVGLAAALFGAFVIGIELVRGEDPAVGLVSQGSVLTGVIVGINGLCGMLFLGMAVGGLFGTDTAMAIAVLAVGAVLLVVHLANTELWNRTAPVEPFLTFLALGVAVGVVADDVVRILVLAVGATIAITAATRLSGQWLEVAGHAVAGILVFDALRVVYLVGSVDVLPVTAPTAHAGMYGVLLVFYYGFFAGSRADVIAEPARPRRFQQISTIYGWIGAVLFALLFEILLAGAALSAAWALLGFGMIGAGTAGEVRQFRLQGMGLLGITTLKVFLLDTAGLDPVPRILSFLVLGVVLLATAYVYARNRADLDLPRVGRDID